MSILRANGLRNLQGTTSVDLRYLALMEQAYSSLGSYTAGIVVSAQSEYVVRGTDKYIPLPSVELPFTTTGIWDGSDELLFTKLPSLSDLESEIGSGKIGYSFPENYSEDTVGKELKNVTYTNAALGGFFDYWVMGYSRSVLGTERTQIPAGVTHSRAGFSTGTTIYQAGSGQLRVQRNAGDTSNATHTAVINLSAAETAPLRGKTCTAHLYARSGSTYTGTGITFKVQHSVEMEQPILASNGQYSNGNEVSASVTFSPNSQYPDTPANVTFAVPIDAVQVSLCVEIPFEGTAEANDYIELQEAAIYVASGVRKVAKASRATLEAFGASRYQTSYPYGSSFGANSQQGSVMSVANSTNVSWSFSADVRFTPRMVVPPRFQFVAPGSGIRSRMLNVDTGAFINGLAYNLSDSGVTVTNNAATVSGNRYLFQWAADCLF